MLPSPLSKQAWINKHGTVQQTVARVYAPNNLDANGLSSWQNGRAACRELVKKAEAAGVSLAPVGSAWSLSEAVRVAPKGWLVETSFLTEVPVVGMEAAHVVSGGPDRAHLVFAQSGNLVQRMHIALAARGLALATSGASCGQTLAGCISTGTHGAALGFGAMQEMVRGVNLIITGGESVWVEPASHPVVTAAWCTAIGARLIRDNDIFASAIVSFGTMGLVHAYLLEVRPMYLLSSHVRAATLGQLYAGISRSGDTAVVNLPSTIAPNGNANIVHLSVSIDVNPAGDNCRVEVIYAAGDAPNHHPVIGPAARRPPPIRSGPSPSTTQESPWFTLADASVPFDVAPGAERRLTMTFSPNHEGPAKATLRLQTSAGELTVAINGVSETIRGLIGATGPHPGSGGPDREGTVIGTPPAPTRGAGGIAAVGGDAIISGALDKSLIDAVIKRNMNQIRYCYQRELARDKALRGKITVKFVVAMDGTVTSATTKSTTMHNAAVESCINGRFLKFQFPEPNGGGIVIVSYPFIFGPPPPTPQTPPAP